MKGIFKNQQVDIVKYDLKNSGTHKYPDIQITRVYIVYNGEVVPVSPDEVTFITESGPTQAGFRITG